MTGDASRPAGEHRHLMSTTSLANRTAEWDEFNGEKNTGIFNTDPALNPDFHNASAVFIVYCSSDSHAGNATTAQSGLDWSFHGKDIVHAVISDLLAEVGGLAGTADMVLTGGSAGGMATFLNADYVKGLVAAAPLPSNSEMRCVS